MTRGREKKPHIGIFGRRNIGKSSFINCLADQDIAIVSEIAGTTTDPVKKSIEIQGIGPVIFVDTAGIDDSGELGNKRIAKTLKSLELIDFAILVIAANQFDKFEKDLISKFNYYKIPFIIVHNKTDVEDIRPETLVNIKENSGIEPFALSVTKNDAGKHQGLIDLIIEKMPDTAWAKPSLLGDLLNYGDIVLLITPIDIEAPEGRLI